MIALPSGFNSSIKSIESMDGPLEEAFAPMSVTITLEDEIDISRGDMLVKTNSQPKPVQDISAMICWFSADKQLTGRGKYILRHTTKEVKAIVTEVCYKVDIGRVNIHTSAPLIADEYRSNRITGSFVLIDELTNATVAAGMIL